MKKTLFLIGALVSLVLTSCLGGGSTSGTTSATVYGVLTVTETSTGEVSYKDEEASITVSIPDMFVAELEITYNGIKFDKMMPKLNVTIPKIPFTESIAEDNSSLNYIFEAYNVVPRVGDTPYEKYIMERVVGCIGRTTDVIFVLASKDKTVKFTSAKESSSEDSNSGGNTEQTPSEEGAESEE